MFRVFIPNAKKSSWWRISAPAVPLWRYTVASRALVHWRNRHCRYRGDPENEDIRCAGKTSSRLRLKDQCSVVNVVNTSASKSHGHVTFFNYIRVRKKTHQNYKTGMLSQHIEIRFHHPKRRRRIFFPDISGCFQSPSNQLSILFDPGAPNWLAHARDRGKACLVASRWQDLQVPSRAFMGFPL